MAHWGPPGNSYFGHISTPGWPWHGGAGGHPNPLGHPGAAQALASQNGPGSHLDAPNGAFKVGPKAGHRRLHVQDPGDRALDCTSGPPQSAIRHHLTPFRDTAWSYFGALGSTRKLIFWSYFHPWGSPGWLWGTNAGHGQTPCIHIKCKIYTLDTGAPAVQGMWRAGGQRAGVKPPITTHGGAKPPIATHGGENHP